MTKVLYAVKVNGTRVESDVLNKISTKTLQEELRKVKTKVKYDVEKVRTFTYN